MWKWLRQKWNGGVQADKSRHDHFEIETSQGTLVMERTVRPDPNNPSFKDPKENFMVSLQGGERVIGYNLATSQAPDQPKAHLLAQEAVKALADGGFISNAEGERLAVLAVDAFDAPKATPAEPTKSSHTVQMVGQ